MNEQNGERWMEKIGPFTRHRFHSSRLKEKTALLVIDIQRFFIDKDGGVCLPGGREMVTNTRTLLEAFRGSGLPVVFTRHEDRAGDIHGAMGRWWGRLMEPGDPRLEIVSELEPLMGERVIRKNQYSAFHRTDLSEHLRREGVKGVVVCGVMTHFCCETTARDAFMENFDVTIAVDAMASSCEELHIAALMTLADGFAAPALSRSIAEAVRS